MRFKTLFIITSPFQALCVWEAIHKFDVRDYKIVVIATPNDKRYVQVKETLMYLKLSFDSIVVQKSTLAEVRRVGSTLSNSQKFRDVFVGDCCDIWLVTLATYLVKFHGRLLFLDDGASTISYLNSTDFSFSYKVKRRFVACVYYAKTLHKSTFFTIFNKKEGCTYNVIHNDFALLNTESEIKTEGLYLIGTNIDVYCKEYHLTIKDYIGFFCAITEEAIKINKGPIYYIEHGRCNNQEARDICNDRGITVLHPDVPIELFFIKNKKKPDRIIGFDTTALFTIKGMYNNCDALNIQIKNDINMHHSFQKLYKQLLVEIGVPTKTFYSNYDK